MVMFTLGKDLEARNLQIGEDGEIYIIKRFGEAYMVTDVNEHHVGVLYCVERGYDHVRKISDQAFPE